MVTVALKIELICQGKQKREKKKKASERSTDFPVSGSGAAKLYSTSLWRAPHEI